MPNKIKLILFSTALVFIFSFALPVLSAYDMPRLINANCTGGGNTIENCGLTQMFETIINISQIILYLTGSAALLMFVYGGVLWIISAGSSEQVQKGKTAMTSAAIGIAIILCAWTAVNVTILAITKGEVGGTGVIFGQYWFNEKKIDSTPEPGTPNDATTDEGGV